MHQRSFGIAWRRIDAVREDSANRGSVPNIGGEARDRKKRDESGQVLLEQPRPAVFAGLLGLGRSCDLRRLGPAHDLRCLRPRGELRCLWPGSDLSCLWRGSDLRHGC